MEKKRVGRKIKVSESIDETEAQDEYASASGSLDAASNTKSIVERSWDSFARQLIQETLVDANLGFRELTLALNDLGLPFTQKAVCRRVSRGHFSGGFFLLCMQALQVVRIDFDGERHGVTRTENQAAELESDSLRRPKSDAVSTESIVLGWSGKKAFPHDA